MRYTVTGFLPRQAQIYFNGFAGLKPRIPTSFDKLEELAGKVLSEDSLASISGGAGSESTMILNRKRFDQWAIVPRILKDINSIDTSTKIFNSELDIPFMIAPAASHDLAHPDGEIATAKAAASENVPMIFSMFSSHAMEEISSVMGNSLRWQQIYWSKSDSFNQSMIRRAEACGSSAFVVTLDTQLVGWRPRDLDLGFTTVTTLSGMANHMSDPIFNDLLDEIIRSGEVAAKPPINFRSISNLLRMSHRYPGSFIDNLKTLKAPKAANLYSQLFSQPTLKWDDLIALKRSTRLPVLIKGVLHPEDAELAIKHGLDGIVVSNHGGRQLASSLPTIDALPDIVSIAKGRIPILFDSGIRNGDDIFKALALGADVVLIGRPFLYALAIAGEQGVKELLQNLKAEFQITMALAGCTKISEITADKVKKLTI